jgi:chemotaxis protein MotB
MNREREVPVRIIYRRKKGVHAHHGGAWKVALADFMTAMFALFLVLWLVNQSSDVKAAVAGYFQDPLGRAKEFGSSILPGDGAQASTVRVLNPTQIVDLRRDRLNQVARQLRERLDQVPELAGLRDKVDIELTAEGLRVQLLEDPKGVFFQTGSANLSKSGRDMLAMLASELGKLPNKIRIEGHTDARPYSGRSSYTNWELSADRANAARRILTENGMADSQIIQIRGFADRVLRVPSDPFAASNRRISIMVLLGESASRKEPGSMAAATDSAGADTGATTAAGTPPAATAPDAAASTEHAP